MGGVKKWENEKIEKMNLWWLSGFVKWVSFSHFLTPPISIYSCRYLTLVIFSLVSFVTDEGSRAETSQLFVSATIKFAHLCQFFAYNKSFYCMLWCITSWVAHWESHILLHYTFLPFRNVAAFATLASVMGTTYIQLSGASVHTRWQTREDCSSSDHCWKWGPT